MEIGTAKSNAEKVAALAAASRQVEQIDIPLRHFYSHGVYLREMTMPAGAVVTGKVHKYDNAHIISKGDVSVQTDEGLIRIRAPFTFIAKAGSQRAFFAHEETVWTTIIGTDEKNPEAIEKAFLVETYDQYQLFCDEQKLIESKV